MLSQWCVTPLSRITLGVSGRNQASKIVSGRVHRLLVTDFPLMPHPPLPVLWLPKVHKPHVHLRVIVRIWWLRKDFAKTINGPSNTFTSHLYFFDKISCNRKDPRSSATRAPEKMKESRGAACEGWFYLFQRGLRMVMEISDVAVDDGVWAIGVNTASGFISSCVVTQPLIRAFYLC
jgi:hypothetical protein